MIMHFTFYDGSNPYFMMNASADACKRAYRQWSRGHKTPLENIARIDVISSAVDGLRIYATAGGFTVAWKDAYKVEHFSKRYERFANAINAMGKMSAKMQAEGIKQ